MQEQRDLGFEAEKSLKLVGHVERAGSEANYILRLIGGLNT